MHNPFYRRAIFLDCALPNSTAIGNSGLDPFYTTTWATEQYFYSIVHFTENKITIG